MTGYLTREGVNNGTVGVHCYHRELETKFEGDQKFGADTGYRELMDLPQLENRAGQNPHQRKRGKIGEEKA